MKARFLACLLATALLPACFAETVKDREGSVRADRAKMESNQRWIYNDPNEAFAAAQLTGKPVMVILRCVPCLACMGLDTSILTESDELKPLLDQFVRARVINANSLDLDLFQFDYDLSFTAMFFGPDKTILGRFGSWSHQKDSQKNSVTTFKQALEGALDIHKNLKTVKASLADKQSRPSRFDSAIDMPSLKGKYASKLDWNGKVVKSCVHCHQIGDATRFIYREQNKPIPLQWIYPFPDLEVTGASLGDKQATTISMISPSSPAARAGLKKGDKITHINSAPVISSADISWSLHHVPNTANVPIAFERDGKSHSVTLNLPNNWRTQSNIERRVGSWPMRAMAFGGMKLQALTAEEKQARRLPANAMALEAKHVGQYGKHAMAKRAGFIKGDIIISVAGSKRPMAESQLIGALITNYKPGHKVPAEVLRKGRKLSLKIPVQ